MNWKNPIRVFAVLGWLVVQGFVLLGWAGWRVFQGFMLLGWAVFRAGQFIVALPALLLFFFGGVWYAVWSFVRRPFPSLDENPVLALVNYHTPNFFSWLVLWYYLSPFVAVMLCGLISVTVWKVWLEGRRRDFAPFTKLPPWPLDPKQKAPAIVIGEVHHPVETREIFSPSWLTIPERGLYTGVAIFGAVGSGKTSACMNPFARQLLGWQAGNEQMRAAALVLEVKGDFCHDIRQILVEAGRGSDYIELGMDARSQWNPLSAWWLDSYSLAYTREAERVLRSRRNILVSGGTGSGKTTLLNALIELLPDDERIVAIEDTLELRIERSNCVRFEARGLQEGAVTIRDLVRHALRHRPDHIVVGEVRGGEAADLLEALNTGHGGSLTTVHANNATSALSRIASCAMQGGGELPWEVTCRGVVDGIAMVIHMTRHEGRRFAEEAVFVKGYEARNNQWDIQRITVEGA